MLKGAKFDHLSRANKKAAVAHDNGDVDTAYKFATRGPIRPSVKKMARMTSVRKGGR